MNRHYQSNNKLKPNSIKIEAFCCFLMNLTTVSNPIETKTIMLIKSTVQKISLFSGTVLLLFLFPTICKAGGYSFLFEIQSLQSKGNNQYKLTLKCLEKNADCGRSNRMIIHLRFNKSAFGERPFHKLTPENYLKCIEKLKERSRKGGSFRFGFMGVGVYRISGKKDEYQSNGLAELEENDGSTAIYSFANPI